MVAAQIRRMVCKKCGKIFEPHTYRERITGTCSDDSCYVPFSDQGDVRHVREDYTSFVFKCLKCDAPIYTNDKSERLCARCRRP